MPLPALTIQALSFLSIAKSFLLFNVKLVATICSFHDKYEEQIGFFLFGRFCILECFLFLVFSLFGPSYMALLADLVDKM